MYKYSTFPRLKHQLKITYVLSLCRPHFKYSKLEDSKTINIYNPPKILKVDFLKLPVFE